MWVWGIIINLFSDYYYIGMNGRWYFRNDFFWFFDVFEDEIDCYDVMKDRLWSVYRSVRGRVGDYYEDLRGSNGGYIFDWYYEDFR